MKTNILIAAAAGALFFSPAATAQTQPQGDIFGRLLGSIFGTNQRASEQTLEADWDQRRRPFAQRGPVLDQRIDAAVRDGSIDRYEAEQMRREYNEIVRLEAQYSANGAISPQQRADLRTRYRALNQRVGGQGIGQGNAQNVDQDGYQNQGRWQPVATRNSEFEQRITAGLRNRSLTRAEAMQLRTEWRSLTQVEAGYQRGGIDAREQADLWNRYNVIESRLGGDASGTVGYGNDRNTARWDQMGSQLTRAERDGTISRVEAVQVRAQLADLARLDAAYAASGYTVDERSYLQRRFSDLERLLGANLR